MNHPSQVLKRGDAAALIGVSASTFKRRAAADPAFPPAIQIGVGRCGYRVSDLVAYVDTLAKRAATAARRAPPHDPAAAGRASGAARRARAAARRAEAAQ